MNPVWITPRTLAASLLQAGAALAATWLGWDFGLRIGGAPMALVAALNCAVMAALLVDAVFDRLWPDRRRA